MTGSASQATEPDCGVDEQAWPSRSQLWRRGGEGATQARRGGRYSQVTVILIHTICQTGMVTSSCRSFTHVLTPVERGAFISYRECEEGRTGSADPAFRDGGERWRSVSGCSIVGSTPASADPKLYSLAKKNWLSAIKRNPVRDERECKRESAIALVSGTDEGWTDLR